MEIVVFKLVTGEEVIARKDPENVPGGAFFIKPRTFTAMQDPSTGGVRAGLLPWLMSDPDATVLIANAHIIAMTDASKQLEDAYLQQTSGIDLTGTSKF